MTHPAITRLLALGGELTPGSERRKYDLAHMRTLLHALGNPHLRFRSVLIAGTNGKGSTAATLASILQAAGHRTGLYTSPHLEQPNERIRINGLPIADAALATLFTRVEAVSARLVASAELPHPPSFFETITAIAFLHFAGEQPDPTHSATELSPIGPSGQTTDDHLSTAGAPQGHPERSANLASSQITGDHASLAGPPSGHPERSPQAAGGSACVKGPAENPNPFASSTPIDIAVLEVGLGGRLDATNVVEPLLSILTDISIDHTAWLGHSLSEITREKAGILRPHGTLITLPQHPEANQVIGEIAVPLQVQAISAADYLPSRSADLEPATSLLAMLRNRYTLPLPQGAFAANTASLLHVDPPLGGAHRQPNPARAIDPALLHIDSPLGGAHQQRNLALAIAAAIALHQQHGFALSPSAIEQGLYSTFWPARLQLLRPPAMPGQRRPATPHQAPVLLDAAHNPSGAWALRAALSPLPVTGPRTLVFACMADKAIPELAQILFPVFDEVLLTQSSSPRAAPLDQLAAAAEPTGALYRTFPSAPAALAAAQSATPAHGLIVLAGSIALLGELTPLLPGWL